MTYFLLKVEIKITITSDGCFCLCLGYFNPKSEVVSKPNLLYGGCSKSSFQSNRTSVYVAQTLHQLEGGEKSNPVRY